MDFLKLIPILISNGFRVIGFDAPCHGFSKGSQSDIGEFWVCIEKLSNLYGNDFDLAVSHSFGSAALTFQMRTNKIQVKNIVMLSPNAVYDSVIFGFLRLCNIQSDVYPPLCDLIVEKFANRIDREGLWNACATEKNMSEVVVASAVKSCLILHGSKDNMFDPEESYKVAQVCQQIKCTVHILECGHREILAEPETQENLSAFCQQILTAPMSLAAFDRHRFRVEDMAKADNNISDSLKSSL